jgi:capsular exopolysaccharide synthesis family protein
MSVKSAASMNGALHWNSSEMLVTLDDRMGMAAEQYKKMCIRLEALRDNVGAAMRVIVVTSPMMSDGKTATATNLALSLAREESRRVLIMDCDIRKPRLSGMFDKPPTRGLADLLVGSASFGEVVCPTDSPSLEVITLPRRSDLNIDPLPVERLRTVLRELRSRYDYIICDAPPVLPIADAVALTRLGDGVVLVVRAGVTPREAVKRTLDSIDRTKLVGFVLNGVAGRTLGKYYYRYHAEEEAERGRKA